MRGTRCEEGCLLITPQTRVSSMVLWHVSSAHTHTHVRPPLVDPFCGSGHLIHTFIHSSRPRLSQSVASVRKGGPFMGCSKVDIGYSYPEQHGHPQEDNLEPRSTLSTSTKGHSGTALHNTDCRISREVDRRLVRVDAGQVAVP